MMTRRMLQISTSVGVVILLSAMTVLIAGVTQSGATYAQDPSKCTLKTIQGTYLFEARGVVRDGQKVLPYAEAGTWTLDGAGKAQGVYSASIDGEVIAGQEPFTATYKLKSGCVFTVISPVGDQIVEFHIYTNDLGSSITYFSPGVSGAMFKR